MKTARTLASCCAFGLPLLLSGCFLISTTRKLPVHKNAIVETATPDQLVEQLNQRWAALDNMTTKVDIHASVLKASTGEDTTYTTVSGNIVFSKPNKLRVLGRTPVIGVKIFDLASDGKSFTLYIPQKKIAIKGLNTLTKKSAIWYENIRPDFFTNALAVRGLEPDEYYSVTSDSETVEDAAKKHLYFVQEYVLSITRHIPGSHRDKPVRVITFRRDSLLPSGQDLYDAEGNLETQVTYSDYRDFGFGMYPSTIVIKRPLDNLQIVLTTVTVNKNIDMPADQFALTVPDETQIKNLE